MLYKTRGFSFCHWTTNGKGAVALVALTYSVRGFVIHWCPGIVPGLFKRESSYHVMVEAKKRLVNHTIPSPNASQEEWGGEARGNAISKHGYRRLWVTESPKQSKIEVKKITAHTLKVTFTFVSWFEDLTKIFWFECCFIIDKIWVGHKCPIWHLSNYSM